jgi:hypothetical protein
MSYDVYLAKNEKKEEFIANYTYNVSPMYYDALGFSINDLDGMNAKEARLLIINALVRMTEEPDKYKAMNPDNGWGNYEGAMNFLSKILLSCIEHPKRTIRVS